LEHLGLNGEGDVVYRTLERPPEVGVNCV